MFKIKLWLEYSIEIWGTFSYLPKKLKSFVDFIQWNAFGRKSKILTLVNFWMSYLKSKFLTDKCLNYEFGEPCVFMYKIYKLTVFVFVLIKCKFPFAVKMKSVKELTCDLVLWISWFLFSALIASHFVAQAGLEPGAVLPSQLAWQMSHYAKWILYN